MRKIWFILILSLISCDYGFDLGNVLRQVNRESGPNLSNLSTNNFLSSLSLIKPSIGLSPTFSKEVTSYTAIVPFSVSSLDILATAENLKSNVTGSGTKLLDVGDNIFPITVKAEDGSEKTYTMNVHRKSNDATLNNILGTNLTFSFDPDTYSYEITVANGVSSTEITAYTKNALAKVKVNGTIVTSVPPSATIELPKIDSEINIILIEIIAEDDSYTKTYTLNITRNAPLNSNADLTALDLTGMVLSPSFTSGTVAYTANVPVASTSTILSAQTAEVPATMKYDINSANTFPSFDGDEGISLTGTTMTIVIRVIAQDNTTIKDYTITITRLDTLTLSVTDIISPPGEQKIINITGGTPPYTAILVSGDLDNTFNVSSNELTFKAGNNPGDGKILVVDSENKGAYLSFHVTSRYLLIPGEVGVKINSFVTFEVSGGTAPYTISLQSGSGTVEKVTGDTFKYTATAASGTMNLLVKDATDKFYYIDVVVTSNQTYALSPMVIKTGLTGTTVNLNPSGDSGITPYRICITGSFPAGTKLNGVTPVDNSYVNAPATLYVPSVSIATTIYVRVDDQEPGGEYNIPVKILP